MPAPILTIPSEELLTQVIDKNATGITILDPSMNIIFWNQWMSNASSLAKEDVLHKNLFSVFPEMKNSRIEKAIELSISKGNASFISHTFNKNPFPLYSNGDKNKPIRQLTYIKPVKLKNNDRYCFIQINDSTTSVYREEQLRKMAHDAQSLTKLKSGFVSSVSHELRTPLTSIMGALGLLKNGADNVNPESMKTMLDIAYNNADRLLLLISDLLDMEKIESGKMDFNFSTININELIDLCITQNKGLSDKYEVQFNFNKDDNIPLVLADKDRIIQVLNNLMSNAAKFEPNRGTIEITSSHANNMVHVAVLDHGSGIPDEFKDKIFKAFTQADVSNTKNISGTGLGLAISKTIIEHHHGELSFDCINKQGTCFYFTLPVNKQ